MTNETGHSENTRTYVASVVKEEIWSFFFLSGPEHFVLSAISDPKIFENKLSLVQQNVYPSANEQKIMFFM